MSPVILPPAFVMLPHRHGNSSNIDMCDISKILDGPSRSKCGKFIFWPQQFIAASHRNTRERILLLHRNTRRFMGGIRNKIPTSISLLLSSLPSPVSSLPPNKARNSELYRMSPLLYSKSRITPTKMNNFCHVISHWDCGSGMTAIL